MKIEILGTNCDKCSRLYENTLQAIKDLNIEAEVEKVNDMYRIMSSGTLMTPALMIDGTLAAAGKILSVDQIKQILS